VTVLSTAQIAVVADDGAEIEINMTLQVNTKNVRNLFIENLA
jgi:hypothetical protein